MPEYAEHFFKRPAVEEMLRHAFQKPLTTVIAGAGYGKTQAVLSALNGMEQNSAWIQLSRLDNYTVRFWERVAAALGSQNRDLYDSLVALGYPESIVHFDRFLKLLDKALTPEKPFILVFDDFHLIENPGILNFIELFISAHVPHISVIIIARKKPAISLSGMLSKGLLARVTEDDLRFSPEEVEAYLRMQGLRLSESVVSDICAYTDGWIFAIYLVSLSAKNGNLQNPVFPAKIDIFDLIKTEIFSAASQELQDFLLRISVLTVIPSGLFKELAGHNRSLISEALQMSMFIRYDAASDSYCIHHLLQEFLREDQSRQPGPDVSETHLAAAEWYAGHNNRLEAIYHYKELGRYREIFRLIMAIPGRVPHESAEILVGLIEQAPEEMVRAMPVIRVAKAGYLFNNNRLEEAKQELSQLREEFEALPGTEENRTILGETYLLLAVISMVSLDYAFEELFQMADARLPGGSMLVDYRTGFAEGVNACSIKDPAAGELQRRRDALFRAAPYMVRAMNGCGCGLEYLNAAESSLYTGDWKAAEQYAYEAVYRSKEYSQGDISYMADFVLVRIFTARGKYETVTGILNGLEQQLDPLPHADCIPLYDMISGWFYTKLGKTGQVAPWVRSEEETRKVLAPVVIGREYLVRSDCLLAEERYYELLALMEQTDKLYEKRGILFAVIQNKITKAIVHHYLGNHAESIRYFNEAYNLSRPNDLIMQFLEYGNRMRTLIHSARQNESCKIPRDWLDQIYTKSSSYAKMLSQLVSAYDTAHAAGGSDPVPLSKRESEVLACLYQGMTRKEIADGCYISLSTVNSILKNIYNKLGAANAADAVRIAKEKEIAYR